MAKDIKPEFAPHRPGDVKKTQADISNMKKVLGVEPKVKFAEGLKNTLNWFNSTKVELV